jgi:hypothetical protein
VVSGEDVEVEAYLEWTPNSLAPDAAAEARSNANGVATARLVIDRPGNYTVFFSWAGEWEGRLVEVTEADDDATLVIEVDLYEGGPW